MSVLLCRDCRNFIQDANGSGRCLLFRDVPDLVHGETPKFELAMLARLDSSECRENGKFWQQK